LLRGRRATSFASDAQIQLLVPAGAIALVIIFVIVVGMFPITVRSESAPPVFRASVLSLPGPTGPVLGLVATNPIPQVSRPSPEPVRVSVPAFTLEQLLYVPDANVVRAVVALNTAREASPSEGEALSGHVNPDTEEKRPIFYRYVVLPGDTITDIAGRFGIDDDYIIWNNIEIIPNRDLLSVGDKLQIPGVEGIIHDIRINETLIEIADRYDADPADIVAFAANKIVDPDFLTEGSTILVPGGQIVRRAASVLRNVPVQPSIAQREVSDFGFVWPVKDVITSYFGPDHPLGIDINVPMGTPIAAAAAGQVTFVGGIVCCSYGLYVEIKHDEAFTTLYSHLDRWTVDLGEWVEGGQIIGIGGWTGRSTGPHLHFELRKNGAPQNPLLYLP
jgi:murein DD-endopeptidase MepM/ murein hydrolase activator NlpD